MKWSSAVSEEPSIAAAVRHCAERIRRDLENRQPDLVFAFVSQHHASQYDRLPRLIDEALQPRHSVGCSAGGVIGGGAEVEQRPGVSLTAAVLPSVQVTPFQLDTAALPDPGSEHEVWEARIGVAAERLPHFVILADPVTFDAERFLGGMDTSFPESRKIGGLASGAKEPDPSVLYLDGELHRSGVVGVGVHGDVEVNTLVAQGCRPIGSPMFVTRCQRNVLQELDGRPPYEVLTEVYHALSAEEQQLFQQSLFLGIVMRPQQQEYAQGDFLIRNVIGLDRETGFLVIGAMLSPQLVVQFHLRDAETSRKDLETLLRGHRESQHNAPPQGALLFSCLGRGMYLYGEPDHDTNLFRHYLGPVPLGGFFCNGEIGPVHGSTFLHGYTSSFGLFRSARGVA